MASCRICGGDIQPFMSFGSMPNANRFLTEAQFPDEPFYELAACFCASCNMFQLKEQPAPESMFNETYAYHSGTSGAMAAHFEALAKETIARRLVDRADPFVVEIGSNDGILLRHFKDAGVRLLGVEPSANVAQIARDAGVETEVAFFSKETAERIRAAHGPADAIFAANVMSHIATLPDILAGVAALLSENGVLIVESPYLGAVIEKGSYDQIYDEHVYLFSCLSLVEAVKPHGLALVEATPIWVHGGSMRWVFARVGAEQPDPSVAAALAAERAAGLDDPACYERFKKRCEASRDGLQALLRELKGKGARIVGYGATAKSATVLNYCGIGPDLIEFISDTTPIKQGKFSPGKHIPIRGPEVFHADYPDYAVLFAWNHAEEIKAKETAFVEAGGKWIHFVPELEIKT